MSSIKENIPDDDVAYFGTTNYRGEERKFGIKLNDRRKHMYVVGKTGMGKTTLLENLAAQDIRRGHGMAFVDPHGESSEKLLDFVPAERINDVVYFNPADTDWPIAFNILEYVDEEYRNVVADGLVNVFKKLWADSWGPRLEYILRNAILALLENPGNTILGVTRMLVDATFRKKILRGVKDPVVKSFWTQEFTGYSERMMGEALSPIQNKVGQFLANSMIRNILGQPKSTISMDEIINDGKILLLNLSKGKLGEIASHLLGSMFITKIQVAAMGRARIKSEDRRDFFLYVDEFQNFTTESFANILSEARKYKLNLVIAHQYIGQLEIDGSTVVRDAVFGNVGTIILFRVGAMDAEFIIKEFEPIFLENDLVNLPFASIYLKLMIDGVSSDAFSANTLPPLFEPEGNADKIIKVSRERYARKREIVEERIMKWSEVAGGGGQQDQGQGRKKKKRKKDSGRREEPREDASQHVPRKFSKDEMPVARGVSLGAALEHTVDFKGNKKDKKRRKRPKRKPKSGKSRKKNEKVQKRGANAVDHSSEIDILKDRGII